MVDMEQPLATDTNTQPIKNKIHSIIAVASGKGGVGKSTVSVLLAHFLKKRGYRVGILDADIYGPSLALMTKASPPSQEGNTIFPGKSSDISVISVGMFADPNKAQVLRGPMAANLLGQLYRQVAWGELDFLIIDYPPGTGDIQLSLSQLLTVNAALLVTTPQDLALLDVRKAISMFKTLNVPLAGIVENMSYFTCSNCQEKHYLLGQGGGAKLAKEFGLCELGSLPANQDLTRAGDKGLFGDDSYFSPQLLEAIEKVGVSFLGELAKIRPAPNLSSFTLNWRS